VVHAAFFSVAAWIALGISGEFAAGPFAAAALYLPLATIVVGAIRLQRGVVGGRPLLVAGDLGVGVILVGHLLSTPEAFLEPSPTAFIVAIALGGTGLLAALMLPLASTVSSVSRAPRDRRMLVALVVADIVSLAGSIALSPPGALADVGGYLLQVGVPTLGFDLAVFAAWWWGSRWLIAAGGLAGLVIVATSLAERTGDLGQIALAGFPYAVAVVAGVIGPRLVSPRGPAPSDADRLNRRDTRAGDVWIVVGAILWPLLVLAGIFPLVTDQCFDCGPQVPFGDELSLLTALTIFIVPIATIVSVVPGARGTRAGRPALLVLAGSGTLLLVDLLIGQTGVARFAFLGVATPPIVLVLLGAAARLWPNTWLSRTGVLAALAAAALVFAWTIQLRGGYVPSSFVGIWFVIASLGEAAAVGPGVKPRDLIQRFRPERRTLIRPGSQGARGLVRTSSRAGRAPSRAGRRRGPQ
jgi:hypothetical protein